MPAKVVQNSGSLEPWTHAWRRAIGFSTATDRLLHYIISGMCPICETKIEDSESLICASCREYIDGAY